MEIEFDGKTWVLTTDDEFADPSGPACQLVLDAMQGLAEAEAEGRTQEVGHWKFTVEFLLKTYWFVEGEE